MAKYTDEQKQTIVNDYNLILIKTITLIQYLINKVPGKNFPN